ncbi:threonine synthase, partial [Faecalibaculum rodentium]|uniref:threonine synthase n=1 Tax=Faecalibaculum rodentium TaxID=1702221 RepID=UPI00258F1908
MVTSYHSTRNKGIQAGAREAVLTGIASDGGLFVRPDLGTEKADLDRILNQSYQENAAYILGLLLPDYTEEELKQAVAAAYTGTFADKAITPLKPVGDLHVLELFHGPTSAFKDVALTMLPQLMSIALQDTEDSAMILTATSGDTGKAALSGFRDVDRTGIAVFYPEGKVSQIQYRQMATQQGSNVKVFAVRGNFDDAQSAVKQLFLDEDLGQWAAGQNIRLSSANSINVGRLVPQVVYYFEAWKQLVNQGVIGRDDKVSFSVPTGNFGDVLAGYYAYRLGLPVKKFVVASNANNVLTEFITTGVYDRNRPFVKTISPSMDILISSNLERLLYYMTDGNTK